MAQIGVYAVPVFLLGVFVMAFINKTNAFDDFVEGAKEGLGTVVSLLPNLVGMIVGVKVFMASGILDTLSAMLAPVLSSINLHPQLLPMMVLRPLSGSAALGYAIEMITMHGPDSFVGRLASVMQASSDTTIYIITVYFAAVGLKEMKHALKLGLITDFFAFGLAIVAVALFF